MCREENVRARSESLCPRPVAGALASGTMFVGQVAQARDLGKGARSMACLKTVPILRKEKVNVKVISLLEGREERDRMALGESVRALNVLGTPDSRLKWFGRRPVWTQLANSYRHCISFVRDLSA